MFDTVKYDIHGERRSSRHNTVTNGGMRKLTEKKGVVPAKDGDARRERGTTNPHPSLIIGNRRKMTSAIYL